MKSGLRYLLIRLIYTNDLINFVNFNYLNFLMSYWISYFNAFNYGNDFILDEDLCCWCLLLDFFANLNYIPLLSFSSSRTDAVRYGQLHIKNQWVYLTLSFRFAVHALITVLPGPAGSTVIRACYFVLTDYLKWKHHKDL